MFGRRVLALVIGVMLGGAGCGRSERGGVASGTGTGTGADTGSSGAARADLVDEPAVTPNQFLAGRVPTLIVGTAGDDRADRAIAGQAGLLHDFAFPSAAIVADTDVRGTWPETPVVYGGPHVNALIASIAPCLPFELAAGHLAIGEARLDRDDVVMVAVVPARARDATCPGYPAFLLYAGTGTPGVEEINSGTVSRGGEPLVIADAMGPLYRGTWVGGAAVLDAPAARPAWTRQAGTVAGVAVTHAFPGGANRPPEAGEGWTSEATAAIDRAVATVVSRLGLDGAGLAITVYLHADRAAKQAATGNAGDGHAVAYARALHVRGNVSPAALESLVAHEATHVLMPQVWGPAGSPLFGEGLAVWVSGQYGGRTLAQWRAASPPAPEVTTLLGPGFRKLPEQEAYPAAGLFVGAVHARVGLAGLRALYGASPGAWDAACRAVKTTPAELQTAFAAALAR